MSKLLDGILLSICYIAVIFLGACPGLFPLVTNFMRHQPNRGDIRYLHLAASTFVIGVLSGLTMWLVRTPLWLIVPVVAMIGISGTLLTDYLLQYDCQQHPHLPSLI